MGTVWGTTIPHAPGRDADAIVAAAAAGELGALVVAGVDPDDTADPRATRAAVEAASFVVSLELRATEVTGAADVVFPVAAVVEKAGSFVNWEGRIRSFEKVLHESHALPDLRVLAGIADELGKPLGFKSVAQVRAELAEIGFWDGSRVPTPTLPGDPVVAVQEPGTHRLATWKQMVDDGSMLDGDENLRATGRAALVLVSAATLLELGIAPGSTVTVAGPRGSITLPVGVAALADEVVWVPSSSGGTNVNRDLGLAGSAVRLVGGTA